MKKYMKRKHFKELIKAELGVLGELKMKIENIRRDHDAARNRISEAINKVMNVDWGDSDKCMKRGELMGQLKGAETILNISYVDLLTMETETRNNIGTMKMKLEIEEVSVKPKIKKKKLQK